MNRSIYAKIEESAMPFQLDLFYKRVFTLATLLLPPLLATACQLDPNGGSVASLSALPSPSPSPALVYSESETSGLSQYSCSIVGSGSTCFTPTSHYVGQAFVLSVRSQLCTVGIGIERQINMPVSSILVYDDSSGQPGTLVATGDSLIVGDSNEGAVATPANQSGTTTNFCTTGSPIVLPAGTYWAVAYWSTIPSNANNAYIGVWGYSLPSKSSLPTLESDDGSAWVRAGMYGGTEKIQLWITAEAAP